MKECKRFAIKTERRTAWLHFCSMLFCFDWNPVLEVGKVGNIFESFSLFCGNWRKKENVQ